MKKTILFLSLIAVLISGCQINQSKEQVQDGGRRDFGARRPDFGQPEREPDIRGLVSSVIGNEIKVLKIERPALSGTGEENASGQDAVDNNEKKTTLGTGAVSGRMPGSGPGMGMRPQGQESEEAAVQMMERMKAMSTGEETVIIPVGIKMLKPGDNPEKMEMIEATLENIKENTMLQIWLNQSVEIPTAEFVLIMK